MTERTAPQDRRAQHIAALGFLIQLASFGTLLGISIWAQSSAIAAVARLILAGLPVWAVLYLIFKQARRVRLEQLETQELRRARATDQSAIFDLDDEGLLLEQNRLRWLIRWLIPGATIVIASMLLLGAIFGWGWTFETAFNSIEEGGIAPTQHPTMLMWFVVGVGLGCFLFASYHLGLSRYPDWRLLHAGATFMMGNALACLALAIALMATTSIPWAEPLLAVVVRAVMIILGLELIVNFILDFYRPRHPGVVSRPAFDSRFLSLLSEPGGIAKSIADAVNYQFGFEVSSTWFYQLLQRWLLPLLVLTGLLVLLTTSIVVVDTDERAVIERAGVIVDRGNGGVLEPGLHLKWPYPIDIVRRAPVGRINSFALGEATEPEDEGEKKAILWTEAHEYVPELMLLVSAPASEGGARLEVNDTQSVAVNLLMVNVPVEYRVKDVRKYLYRYAEPAKLVEAVAYQYLSDHAAGIDSDVLMGPGRDRFNHELRQKIQQRLDELDLGVEVVFLGLRGAHPPAKDNVAAAYHGAINAQITKLASIGTAEAEVRRILTTVAGTEARAKALDEAIRERDRLQTDPNGNPEALASARSRVKQLLLGDAQLGIAPLSGEAAALIADARAASSEKISEASAKVRGFATEVAAYTASPALYKQRKVLEIYTHLDDIRKFLILGDPSNVVVEYITSQEGGLDQVLTDETAKHKTKG